MSTKIIYSFADENPDLQKKNIGCMNVLYQLFDRHHFLTGRSASRNRLHPGKTGNDDKQTNTAIHKTKDKIPKTEAKEKHRRTSSESSRTSFSSSTCSSTFSTLDYTKIAQLEPASIMQTISLDTLSVNFPRNQTDQLDQKSLDLRDIIKDSINREARGLSVIIDNKNNTCRNTIKHIDSPRPLLISTSSNPKVSNLNKSSNLLLASKDSPRFSYDERESREKSIIKLKEHPRLSLDSITSFIKRPYCDLKPNYVIRNQTEDEDSKSSFNPHEELGRYKRPSSVIAKLMGLDQDLESFSGSPKTENNIEQNRISGSPRHFQQSEISPSLKNADSVIKPSLQNLDSPKQALKSYPSVYKVIEKKLEFTKSGKDLKSFKQILEAMQKSKQTLYAKQDQRSKLENPVNLRKKPEIYPPRENYGPSIAIKKPSTLVTKSKNQVSSIIPNKALSNKQDNFMDKKIYKGRIQRDNPKSVSNQFQCSASKSFSSRIRTTQTSRLQQKRLTLEKKPRTTTPSSNSSNPRKTRSSSLNLQQNNDQNRKSPVVWLSGNGSTTASTEQPSPVSVLDAMFFIDELPSLVKKISHAFEDDAASNSDELDWISTDLYQISKNVRLNLSFDIDHMKLTNTEQNKDHKYISEILLASGLLFIDLGSCLRTIQLNPISYLLNPDLFLVLEQPYTKKFTKNREKNHRKLIFDAVNEILFCKFVSTCSNDHCLLQKEPRKIIPYGQKLLEELCSEIDQLQNHNSNSKLWDDLRQQSQKWTDLGSDVSGLVLDIEHLIFKDLISEIIDNGGH